MDRMDTPYIGPDVTPNPRAKGVALTPWPWTGTGAEMMEQRKARGLSPVENNHSIGSKPKKRAINKGAK